MIIIIIQFLYLLYNFKKCFVMVVCYKNQSIIGINDSLIISITKSVIYICFIPNTTLFARQMTVSIIIYTSSYHTVWCHLSRCRACVDEPLTHTLPVWCATNTTKNAPRKLNDILICKEKSMK